MPEYGFRKNCLWGQLFMEILGKPFSSWRIFIGNSLVIIIVKLKLFMVSHLILCHQSTIQCQIYFYCVNHLILHILYTDPLLSCQENLDEEDQEQALTTKDYQYILQTSPGQVPKNQYCTNNTARGLFILTYDE